MGICRHLLAVPTPTLEDAVRAGNEYLQIQTGRSFVSSHMVAMIDDGGKEEEHSVGPMQGSIDPERSIDPMSLMAETLQKLVEKVDRIGQAPMPAQAERKVDLECFRCGCKSHLRRDCRAPFRNQGFPSVQMNDPRKAPRPWGSPMQKNPNRTPVAGNATRPQ